MKFPVTNPADFPVINPRYFNSELKELTYLEVPKSACTSIKSYLGCENDYIPCVAEFPIFTVIRDPLKRFVSGYMELVRGKRTRGAETINEFLDVIDKHGFYDRHITPQFWFLEQHYQVYPDIILYDLEAYLLIHDLPRLNASSFTIEMSDEQIERVTDLYVQDYKIPIEVVI